MIHGNLHPDTHSAVEVARLLDLRPLEPEGGYYRRSGEASTRGSDGRRHWSVILFLVTPEGFSALHRLRRDEIWSFLAGDPLESLRLHAEGRGEWVKLGLNPAAGERVQDVVTAGTWQGTRLAAGGRWALVSCVVAPEFVWEDFELGERAALTEAYPGFAGDITSLTR